MRSTCLLAVPLALVLAACTTGAPGTRSMESSEASAQLAGAASPSPVRTPAPTAPPLDVKVTFDGETCTYIGPTTIVDGTVLRFEFVPDQAVSLAWLLVYGVEVGTTYQDLLDWIERYGDEDVSENIPPWVLEETNTSIQRAGTMGYAIEGVKRGSDGVDYEVGGYQVMCATPRAFPATQLSLAAA